MLRFITLFFLMIEILPLQAQKYNCKNGTIDFHSDAPLEMIYAKSTDLKAIIDPIQQTFAFSVKSSSFRGFNSALQREHFNENYIESTKYETSTFVGKIIEKVDFSKNGIQSIRAKGKLIVHGIEQERIIKSEIEIKDKKVIVRSKFTVLLADHNITIPKIVFQKIAEEIYVTLNAEFLLL